MEYQAAGGLEIIIRRTSVDLLPHTGALSVVLATSICCYCRSTAAATVIYWAVVLEKENFCSQAVVTAALQEICKNTPLTSLVQLLLSESSCCCCSMCGSGCCCCRS